MVAPSSKSWAGAQSRSSEPGIGVSMAPTTDRRPRWVWPVIALAVGSTLAFARVGSTEPGIVYSTYLGGSNNEADVPLGASNVAIAVDALGNRYVTGTTSSPDFPTSPGADGTLDGPLDLFVTKLDPDGSVVYSTYLGGPCGDFARDIAVDAAGNAYVTGRTGHNCPFGGDAGVLVAKLDPTGALVYASFMGGSLADASVGQAIAVDEFGQAYVTGTVLTSSNDFPTTPDAYRTQECANATSFFADVFVAKLSADGGSLLYSTLVCGTGDDSSSSLAIDGSGNAYVGGTTGSSDFPTVNALQPTNLTGPVGVTGFLFELNADGSNLVYSTYLGGSTNDRINGLAIDAQRNVFVTGETESDDFPTTQGVVQPIGGNTLCIETCSEAFVAKIAAGGSALLYSTYLRGELDDAGRDIAVDGEGNAHVGGITNSLYFPVLGAFQTIDRGLTDAFLATLSPDASQILFSTYLGGSMIPGNLGAGWDDGRSIALGATGDLHVAGYTQSFDFPTTPNAFQGVPAGGVCDFLGTPCGDAFVTTISRSASGPVPPVTVYVAPAQAAPGGMLHVSWSGIAGPTASDHFRVCSLGTSSDTTCEVTEIWSTGGAAEGMLDIGLPGELAFGWYDVRLMSPDAESFGVLKPVGRSDPILLPEPTDSAVSLVVLVSLVALERKARRRKYGVPAGVSASASRWRSRGGSPSAPSREIRRPCRSPCP